MSKEVIIAAVVMLLVLGFCTPLGAEDQVISAEDALFICMVYRIVEKHTYVSFTEAEADYLNIVMEAAVRSSRLPALIQKYAPDILKYASLHQVGLPYFVKRLYRSKDGQIRVREQEE